VDELMDGDQIDGEPNREPNRGGVYGDELSDGVGDELSDGVCLVGCFVIGVTNGFFNVVFLSVV